MKVTILIKSRWMGSARAEIFRRQLWAINHLLYPAFRAGGHCLEVCVYAQDYSKDYKQMLCNELTQFPVHWLDAPNSKEMSRIGAVTQSAANTFLAQTKDSNLVIWMDDDLVISPEQMTARNIAVLLDHFKASGHLLYAFALGRECFHAQLLEVVHPTHPYMPGMGKMIWLQPVVLKEAVSVPKFAELCDQDDLAIVATAWLQDPHACRLVFGLGGITHLSLEDDNSDLAHYTSYTIRQGVGLYDVYPDLFVGLSEPAWTIGFVKVEEIERAGSGSTTSLEMENLDSDDLMREL